MGRNKEVPANASSSKTEPAIAGTAALPPFLRQPAVGGPLLVSFHIKPGAKRCGIELQADVVDIAIDAPAREGEANAAVLEYVASVLGVRKAAVSLAAGGKCRDKVLAVEGLAPAAALAALRAAADTSK